jgi:hypothetical protein
MPYKCIADALGTPGSGGRTPGLWRVFQQSTKFLPQLRRVLVTMTLTACMTAASSTSCWAPEIANVRFASFGNSLQSIYFLPWLPPLDRLRHEGSSMAATHVNMLHTDCGTSATRCF